MKLATWNINSIRAREERLARPGSASERPDVLCLQETKVEDAGFPLDAAPQGRLRGRDVRAAQLQRRGDRVDRSRSPTSRAGSATARDDDDARADRGDDARHARRLRLRAERPGPRRRTATPTSSRGSAGCAAYLDRTATPDQPLALCGDMNVTPDDRDVWSPEKWRGPDPLQRRRSARRSPTSPRFGLTDVFRQPPRRRQASTRGGTTAASRSSRTRACGST